MKKSIIIMAMSTALSVRAEPIDLTQQYEYVEQVEPKMSAAWWKRANAASIVLDDVMEQHLISVKDATLDNGTVRYHYQPGQFYEVYVKQASITDIQLASGEYIKDVLASDTQRWIINASVSGEGINQIQHVYVIAKQPRLQNELVITTNLRSYHLLLSSTKTLHMPSVAWSYPVKADEPQNKTRNKQPDSLDTRYTIDAHDNVYWTPKSVYNDGAKTYIVFSSEIQNRDIPVFYIADSGELNLANYRVSNTTIVVDRVFDHGVLKMNDTGEIHIYRQSELARTQSNSININLRDEIGNR